MKIVSIFLALALAAFAADTPPVMSRLTVVAVPSETSAEFNNIMSDTAEIYRTNKAPMRRLCWTSLTGTLRFVTVTPLAGLDQLREPSWLSQQGTEASRRARASRLDNVGGKPSYKIITDLVDTNWEATPGAGPANYVSATVYEVKPGKAADFSALMKQLSEAVKKVGKAKGFYVARISYGASWGEYHVVTSYDSLADIPTSGTSLRTAMGEVAMTAWSEKLNATINSAERDLYRYRPEFSYTPAK